MLAVRFLVVSIVLCQYAAHCQEAVPKAIAQAYDSTLVAIQAARTSDDIHRLVDATDSSDWVSISPTGEKIYRDGAEKQLLGLLSIPPGQRPIPVQKIVYASVLQTKVVVVYWVYRMTKKGPVGSLVRDTWFNAEGGWRRSIHEKFFPDRLIEKP